MNQLNSVRSSNAFLTVDLDRPGKQIGHLMVPHSPDDDAWGVTRVPLAVIANGDGPTVIVQGGNHGDEYEGPIAIGELIRDLDPGEVQGRLILMPASNVHAATAARRTSPVDGLNFNRAFPGDPFGSITERIVAYINDRLFSVADAFIDLHSGGTSLDIVPSAIVQPTDDAGLRQRNIAVAQAFDAPLTVVIDNLGDPRTSMAAASRAGLVTLGTELGGGGTVSADALEIARRGVRNVLGHLGVLPSETRSVANGDRRMLGLQGPAAYVYATCDGIFESFHRNGDEVRAGQPAGRIHCTWDPSRPPETLQFGADGVLFGRRHPGRVMPGNCCLVVASDYDGAFV